LYDMRSWSLFSPKDPRATVSALQNYITEMIDAKIPSRCHSNRSNDAVEDARSELKRIRMSLIAGWRLANKEINKARKECKPSLS
jgi:hypothetical protein